MAVRAKDIAKEIGVSEATLSLVINGKPGISARTRQRVLQNLKDMGYDYLLSHEPEQDKRIISFVLYKKQGELLGMNSFFPLILDGIESTARRSGYTLNIINIEQAYASDQLHYISESGCAGFVIFATEMHREDIEQFEKLGIPFVIFDNYFPDKEITSIKVNNEQGTYLAVKHLYEMGHRKIGYLESGLAINSFYERRRRALDAMEDLGLTGCGSYVFQIGYPHDNAELQMDQILEHTDASKLPTAFLADNDLVAVGAMQSFKKHGFRVPEDVSFIGYDDRPICTLTDPKLTTVQLPREVFGSQAILQLIQQIQGQSNACLTVSINGTLVERGSVADLGNAIVAEQ